MSSALQQEAGHKGNQAEQTHVQALSIGRTAAERQVAESALTSYTPLCSPASVVHVPARPVKSQTRTVPSYEPLNSSVPQWESARQRTCSVCSVKVRRQTQSSPAAHSMMVLSYKPRCRWLSVLPWDWPLRGVPQAVLLGGAPMTLRKRQLVCRRWPRPGLYAL